ncbi:MAG: hypothetical protein OSJ73_21370, partial [Lachnospiraceae bacterium]|nr:hypothetical protein [Lachnospiraceae bacterium]
DLVASDAESARTYYHYASNEMGSITHVVEEDQVRNHYEYDVWGNATTCEETIENRFRFNGQQYDPITQQYYLRARFYNPVIGRFTQEDTYRGDGLNLYAYCANNPVYYVDPSGNVPQCIKDAYDKIRKEKPRISEQEAWKRTCEGTGYEYLLDNSWGKPLTAWTNAELQWAVDRLYKMDHSTYDYHVVYALTVTPDDKVIFTANTNAEINRKSKQSLAAAKDMFKNNLEIVLGEHEADYQGSPYKTTQGKSNKTHAEARAAKYILESMGINTSTNPMPRLKNALKGYRQATTDYACDGCDQMQQDLGITNATGTRRKEGKGRRTQRLYY